MQIEYVQSRSLRWVPIAGGTLLHSSVDPEREAVAMVDREWAQISDVKSLVILGLGGGFHIEELLRRKPFNIVVIEAEKNITLACQERHPGLLEKVDVLAAAPPARLINEPEMVHAMSGSYGVFSHPASVHLSPFYYAAVMKTINDRTVNQLRQMAAGNPRLSHFLKSLDICGDQILTLPMVEEAMIRRGTGLEHEGLIWMTLRELVV